VRLAPRADPIAVDDPTLQAVVRASFEARRKTLRNALSRIAEPSLVQAALDAAEIDGGLRGETLAPEDFERLARAVAEARRQSRPPPHG
jgi:16S rRNA (adenine1518-N6/adenine1519-N6)-dimethyltransferase